MSTTPGQNVAPLRRVDTVVMGRLDAVSTLFRLVGTELYKLRRRTLSKVLFIISIVAMLLTFAVISIPTIFIAVTPAHTLYCTTGNNNGNNSNATQDCLSRKLTSAEQALAESRKQDSLRLVSNSLRLPYSIDVAGQIARTVGLVLIIILAAIIVGGEYADGTIRLLYTRGPTRTQFLLAKIGAILCCAIIGFLIMCIVGVLLGSILNPISGIGVDFSFFSAAWIGHLLLFLLAGIFSLLVYAMMALFIATLGRSTAAGLGAALVWSLLEPIIGGIFTLLGSNIGGSLGSFFKAIPDYLIGDNVTALASNQVQYLQPGAPASSITDLHALLVLAVYLLVFIGLAWWINKRRDVTN